MLSISGLLLKIKKEPSIKLSCQKQAGSDNKNGQKQNTKGSVANVRQSGGH